MKSSIPNFNAQRMVRDYIRNHYAPASRQSKAFAANNCREAQELAVWKQRINAHWHEVSLRRIDDSSAAILAGENLTIRVAVSLGGLAQDDVIMECIVGTESAHSEFTAREFIRFAAVGTNKDGESIFELDFEPPLSGLQYYKLRMYPSHSSLSHPFETGHIIWL